MKLIINKKNEIEITNADERIYTDRKILVLHVSVSTESYDISSLNDMLKDVEIKSLVIANENETIDFSKYNRLFKLKRDLLRNNEKIEIIFAKQEDEKNFAE